VIGDPVPLLDALGREVAIASAVAAAIGLVAWIARRPLRSLPASLQAWLWWLVAARLLLQLGGAPAVELAWLPTSSERSIERSESPVSMQSKPIDGRVSVELAAPAGASSIGEGATGVGSIPPTASSVRASLIDSTRSWAALGALWILGCGSSLLGIGRAFWRRRRMLRASEPVSDRPALEELRRARRLVGIARGVELRRSPLADTPLVAGVMRPTLVLPAAARLAPSELRLALVHELVHVRRFDALRALVPAVARRALFFHPVMRSAEREFALATEAACDAEVLRLTGGKADGYAALLVRFALRPSQAARFAATWSLGGRSIQRRLDMLNADRGRPRNLLLAGAVAALVAVALATPVRLVAGDAPARAGAAVEVAPAVPAISPAPEVGERWSRDGFAPAAPEAASAPPAGPTPARTPPAASSPTAPLPALQAPLAPLAPVAPLESLPPLAPLPPIAPLALPELSNADWLVVIDRGTYLVVEAPRWARHRAEQIAAQEAGPIALIGREGRSFVVRDAAAIDGLRRIFLEQADSARAETEAARQNALEQMESARQTMSEMRESLESRRSGALSTARELERRARLESERAAALGRRLEGGLGEELGASAERAQEAAEALAALEQELAHLRQTEERRRLDVGELQREALRESRERLAAQHDEIQLRTEERRQQLEKQLEEIFARDLAEPLER